MPSQNLPRQHWDSIEETIHVSHGEGVRLETVKDIDAYFDEVIRFWRANCGQRRVYFLVDWSGLYVNLKEVDAYGRNVRRIVDQCARAVVRFGPDRLHRAVFRSMAIKIHVPTTVYGSREEALAVIRGLKDGTVTLSPG
jgi:hypothetical protein